MASVRDAILAYIAGSSCLAAAGTPATAGVVRFRTLPWNVASVPAFAIYPSAELTKPVGMPDSNLLERYLTVTIECRAKGGTPDNALDALLSWAIQKLWADETLGGNANYLGELGTRWDAAASDVVYEVAFLDIQVNYQTLTDDPTKRGFANGT